MENKVLIYLSFISIFIICLSCNNKKESDYNKISKYFENTHNIKLNPNIDKIIVITENGCPACNKNLANYALENFINSSSIILVTAKGSNLDISPFENLKENMYFDWNINPEEYNIFTDSKVIFFNSNDIDTSITINANEIKNQFDFIAHKISNN